VAFSPDGQTIAVSVTDYYSGVVETQLWDLKSGTSWGRPLPPQRSAVFHCEFGAGGKSLLTVHSGEGIARVWTIPPPARDEDKTDRLQLSVECRTGLTEIKDTGMTRSLDFSERMNRHDRLEDMGGPNDLVFEDEPY
jgi:hypothetical protein